MQGLLQGFRCLEVDRVELCSIPWLVSVALGRNLNSPSSSVSTCVSVVLLVEICKISGTYVVIVFSCNLSLVYLRCWRRKYANILVPW